MSRNDANFPWRVVTISAMLLSVLVLIGWVFFFSPGSNNPGVSATNDDARRLAAIENNAMGLEGPTGSDSNLQMLLWDMAQTTHLRESSVLAEMVQSNMNSLGGTTDRGIKQAPFVVLKGANMPAVLVEVGFLSNPEEERLLADAAYRQQVANMLFQSLNRYRQRHASLIGGGSSQ